MESKYYVYIMINKCNTTLYVGMTNDIMRRKWEHQTHFNDGFTSKYKLEKCVYVEEYHNASDAIQREKQIKRWNRNKKFDLINTINPELNDLIPIEKRDDD